MRLQKNQLINYAKDLPGDFAIKYLSGRNEQRLSLHSHEYYEVVFIVEGKVAYQIPSGTYLLRPGDIMLLKPHEMHRPFVLNPNTLYERITLQVRIEKLEALSHYDIDLTRCFKTDSYDVFRIPYYSQNTIRMILGKLLMVSQDKPFGHELLADVYLTELFVKITEFFYADTSSTHTAEKLEPLQLLNMVDQYIAENIDMPIRIDDLANLVCMNKYSLMRCFKELSGCTAYQYIMDKRLKAAESLIRDGVSFSAAAEKCGFSEYSCFYRYFMKKHKMSPQKYFRGDSA